MDGTRERMREVSPEVMVAGEGVLQVAQGEVETLRERLSRAPRGRVRLCAHPEAEDPLHEMLIVLAGGSYIQPHKHLGKSESFHIIEGEVDVVLFDEEGSVVEVIEMGEYRSGRAFYYRLAAPLYHTLLIRSEQLIVHETTNGPFRREETLMAPWAPSEQDPEGGRIFLEELDRRISSSPSG